MNDMVTNTAPAISLRVSYLSIVGEVVRQLRMKKNLKQVEAAELCGYTQSGWSKVERGIVDVPATLLARMGRFFECGSILEISDKAKVWLVKKGVEVVDAPAKKTPRNESIEECGEDLTYASPRPLIANAVKFAISPTAAISSAAIHVPSRPMPSPLATPAGCRIT